MTQSIAFKNRKPSRALVMRSIAEYLKKGITNFYLTWGENWIELQYHSGTWFGTGWIREIGGSDIADELNALRKQTIAEHRQLLNVWNT
jgi:hypothetical protein